MVAGRTVGSDYSVGCRVDSVVRDSDLGPVLWRLNASCIGAGLASTCGGRHSARDLE